MQLKLVGHRKWKTDNSFCIGLSFRISVKTVLDPHILVYFPHPATASQAVQILDCVDRLYRDAQYAISRASRLIRQ